MKKTSKLLILTLVLTMLMSLTAIFIVPASAAEQSLTVKSTEFGLSDGAELGTKTASGFTFAGIKGSGSNAPKYYNSGSAVRIYIGNSITITAPEGATIKSISMVAPSNKYAATSLTPSSGIWSVSSTTATISNINNSSITFSNSGTEQLRVVTFTITYTTGTAACDHTGGTATCLTQATCSKCSQLYGDLGDHKWNAATCTTPKTCSVCQKTEGTTLAHNYVGGVCSGCGAPEPKPGQNVTVTLNIGTYGSAQGWSDTSMHKTIEYEDVKFEASGTDGNTGKYYTKSPGSWRFYSTGNATLTITAPTDATIVSVKIVWSEGGMSVNGSALSSGSAMNVTGESIVVTATAKTFINSIEVVYSVAGGGTPDCEHTGGTPTCTKQAVCDLCGDPYGNLAAHTFNKNGPTCDSCSEPNPNYVPTLTIEEAITKANDTQVKISGTVKSIITEWNGSNMSVAITDGTGSIQLYQLTTQVSLGDIITVSGSIGTYGGNKQIAAGGTAVKTGSDNKYATINYKEVNAADLATVENFDYIKVTGTIVEIAGNNTYIADADGNRALIYKCESEVVLKHNVTVYGIKSTHNGNAQIINVTTHDDLGEHQCTKFDKPTCVQHTCVVCGTVIDGTENHVYEDGKCECGKDEPVISTATFVVPSEYDSIDPVTALSVELPTLSGLDYYNKHNYTFVGWTTSVIDGSTTTAPTIYPGGSTIDLAEDTTFYAVFTYGTVGTNKYEKKDIASITSTDVVVITMTKGNTTWALTSANGASSAPTAVVVTVSGNTITGEVNANLKWNIAKDGANLTIYVNGSTETWLYSTTSNNGIRVGDSDNKTFIIDSQYSYLKQTNTGRYVGVYNASDWRSYTSMHDNISGQTLAFYVLNAGVTYYTTTLEHEHDFSEEVATDAYKATNATCTAAATYYYSCTCGEAGSRTFSYGSTNSSNHTGNVVNGGTADKHTKYECCGATASAEHDMSLWHFDNDKHYAKCECGYISTTGANHSYVYTNNGDTHIGTCTCGAKKTEQHSGGAATCTTLAKCEICNNYYGSIGAHDWDSHVAKKDADCENGGNSAYKHCKTCGNFFAEGAGDYASAQNEGTADKNKFNTNKLGHDWSDLWTAENNQHYHACNRDGCDGKNDVADCYDGNDNNHTCDVCLGAVANEVCSDSDKDSDHNCDECGAAYGTHEYANTLTKGENTHWYECNCGDKKDEAGHSYGNWTKVSETQHKGTCTCGAEKTEAHTQSTAANCENAAHGDVCNSNYGSANGHSYTGSWQSDGTKHWKDCDACGNDGHIGTCSGGTATCTDKAVCTTCGNAHGSVDANNHSFTNYVSDKNATCTADGTKTAECDRCDAIDTVTDTGSAKGHNWGEVAYSWTNYSACTATRVCANDNNHKEVDNAEISVANHKAQCVVNGSNVYTAKFSVTWAETQSKTETIPANGHVFEDTAAKAATCLADGNTAYRFCDNCDLYYASTAESNETTVNGRRENTEFIIAATGHSWSESWTTVDGEHYHACNNCSEKNDVADCYDGNDNNHSCDACGAEGITAHTPAEAVVENKVDSTCHSIGSYDSVIYCSECAAELSRTEKTIEKKAHTPAEAVRENEVDSTCYAEGSYDSVVYCSVEACKAELSRTAETIEKKAHTPAAAVVENKVDPSCTVAGSHEEVVYCSVEACKAELSRDNVVDKALGHNFDGETCTRCDSKGYAYSGEEGNYTYYTDIDALLIAIANGGKFTINSDFTLSESIVIKANTTINTNGKTVTSTAREVIVINGEGVELTVNGKFVVSNTSAALMRTGGGSNVQTVLTIEDVNNVTVILNAEFVLGAEDILYSGDVKSGYSISVKAEYAAHLARFGYATTAGEGGRVNVVERSPYYIGANGNWYMNGFDTGIKAEGQNGQNIVIDRVEEGDKVDNATTYTIYFNIGEPVVLTVYHGNDGADGRGIASIAVADKEANGKLVAKVVTITYTKEIEPGVKTQVFEIPCGQDGQNGKDITIVGEPEVNHDAVNNSTTYTVNFSNDTELSFTVKHGTQGAEGNGIKSIVTSDGEKGGVKGQWITISYTKTAEVSELFIPNGVNGQPGSSVTVDTGRCTSSYDQNTNSTTYTVYFTDNNYISFTVHHGTNGTDGNGISYVSVENGKHEGKDGQWITINYTKGESTEFFVPNGVNGGKGDSITIVGEPEVEHDVVKNSTKYTVNFSDRNSVSFTVQHGVDGKDGNGVKGIQVATDLENNGQWITIYYTKADAEGKSEETFFVPNGVNGTDGNGIDYVETDVDSKGNVLITINYTKSEAITVTIPKGDKGNGIQAIVSEVGTKDDVAGQWITITYTEGSETTKLFVPNGKDGANVTITKTEKTTVESVDTYTITFSDGTTVSFSVTHGIDGDKGDKGDQGDQGEAGKTPYIGENGNWWIGDKDLGIPATGSDGDSGETPYIGENGNWWIGETDTGIKAQGEDGRSNDVIILFTIGIAALCLLTTIVAVVTRKGRRSWWFIL